MAGTFDKDNFIATGCAIDGDSLIPCTVVVENGRASVEEGLSENSDFSALFIADVVNAHTHCGDYGLKVPAGLSLEELVAPPNGLKHRYLRELSEENLRENVIRFDAESSSRGSASFIDFREGGALGCRILRECSSDAVILGRPVSEEYDPEEIDQILSVADGIGLPSISDMSHGYIEKIADDVRSAKKVFAIHVSERVREDIDFVLSLDPAFVVHMCEATDDDMTKCAEAEVPIVVCPSSNAYFGKQTPVTRIIGSGADLAIGTDNGMLCEPDIIAETGRLAEMLRQQGGDPDDAWKSLSTSSRKLLYRINKMKGKVAERYLSVIPQNGGDGVDAYAPRASFRIMINRGVS